MCSKLVNLLLIKVNASSFHLILRKSGTNRKFSRRVPSPGSQKSKQNGVSQVRGRQLFYLHKDIVSVASTKRNVKKITSVFDQVTSIEQFLHNSD